MKSIIFYVSLVSLLSSCGPVQQGSADLSQGISGLLPAQPEKGQLFDYYQPKDLSRWKRNWTYSLDFTGVSWNDSRTCTLIAPQYVVMAAHYQRPLDIPVMFHDRQGNPVERYITKVISLAPTADIALGKLNMSVPSSIKFYRFAASKDLSRGRDVLVTDQTKSVSIHQISQATGSRISLMSHPSLAAIYRRDLIVGDSGNPSFIIAGGTMLLLETHTYGGAGSGPCYADPGVQAAIQNAMSAM